MSFAEVAVSVPLYPNKRFFDYKIPESLLGKVTPGQLIVVPFGRRKTWGVVWRLKDKTDFEGDASKIKELDSFVFEKTVFSKAQLEFAEWMCERYFYPIGEVCEAMLPAAIRKASQKLLNATPKVKEKLSHTLRVLNEEQERVMAEVASSPLAEHLIWGVTGSGKTEVYLHLIQKMIQEDKTSIVLVPEIALTPQLFSRFENAFPGEVAVFHSAQTEKEQRTSWLDIFYGRKKIALGPRSALFAPVSSLGLIVMDEEHEGSYKQEERLRYHARVAAQKLAELSGAKLILGSATPSAETLFRALSQKTGLSKLSARAVKTATRPTVEVVDLKKKLAQKTFQPSPYKEDAGESFPLEPESLFFSEELVYELGQVLERKEQAILFLNRRGLGRARVCKKCGYQPSCLQCAVTLIPHKNKMLCHYCGFETFVPEKCEKCSGEMKEVGFGTQALEEMLQKFFPKIRSLRLDRDVVQDRKKLVETLKSFSDREADVLIGTQMVAKGHDFPQVSLVGVILADIGFSMPDFRNEEKAFQLLTQVAGRAGRAEIPGKVVIQSFRPEEKIFQLLKEGEDLGVYEQFLSEVIETRKYLNYPPFSSLAMIQFQGLDAAEVEAAAVMVNKALDKVKAENFWVLGAVPSPIVKVRNKYRYQILLKSESFEVLKKSLTWVQDKWVGAGLEKKFQNTRLIIDVDPVGMM
ncbi:MAG: primosomal protein N' [Bdellovibrionota bacterium]